MGRRYTRRKKRKSKLIIFFVSISAVGILGVFAAFFFRADQITYSQSSRYSDEELTQMIFQKKGANTLLYYIWGRNHPVSIPFIQKYDVEIHWPDKMNIIVYEKPVIGYISYMGCNMYFDKDGMVVESSTKTLSGVPQVAGLSFKSIVLNSRLEVEDQSVFAKILELSKSFSRYEITVDKIYFGGDSDISIYMGNVKVLLGNFQDLTDKLHELKEISPKLEGLKGTLHLEDYTEDSPSVIFKQEN